MRFQNTNLGFRKFVTLEGFPANVVFKTLWETNLRTIKENTFFANNKTPFERHHTYIQNEHDFNRSTLFVIIQFYYKHYRDFFFQHNILRNILKLLNILYMDLLRGERRFRGSITPTQIMKKLARAPFINVSVLNTENIWQQKIFIFVEYAMDFVGIRVFQTPKRDSKKEMGRLRR